MDFEELPTFDVPVADAPPEPYGGGEPYSVTAYVDFALTSLLRSGRPVLQAVRVTGDESTWTVSDSAFPEAAPTPLPPPSPHMLRPALARVAASYMGTDYLYGGYAEVVLRQEGQRYIAAIYMANDGWRGHWLRVYVRRLDA